MAHPVLTTTWPTGADLKAWLESAGALSAADEAMLDEMVADAADAVYRSIDPNKLPDDVNLCPRSVSRAIVLTAARLMYRKQSPHGVAAFADVAIRLRTVDVDVEMLLGPFRLDPEP